MRSKIGVTLAMVLLISGCYYVEDESSARYNIKKGQKITDTYGYEVKDSYNGMKLKIELDVTDGSISYELKDPSGNIQWSDTVTAGTKLDETKSFNQIEGNWTLNFNNINNEGEGKLKIKFNKLD